MGVYLGWKCRKGRIGAMRRRDGHNAADDTSFNVGAAGLLAPQELSRPRMSIPVPQELSESIPNEVHSTPIYQIE